MGFKIEVSGMEELILQMDKLEDKGRGVAAQALYEGAGVVADAVSSAVNSIATEEFHYTKFGTRMPSPEEKAILKLKCFTGGVADAPNFMLLFELRRIFRSEQTPILS
jgi:hypothetical protein